MSVAKAKRKPKPNRQARYAKAPGGRSARPAKPAKPAPARKPAAPAPKQQAATPRPAPPQAALGAAAIPMGLLMNVLRDVFLERYSLTRKGWRLREARAAGNGAPAESDLAGRTGLEALVNEVMALHDAYTSHEGEFLGAQNPIHHHAGGYQLYYLPRNLYRVLSVLERLPWKEPRPLGRVESWLSGKQQFRVLDLGCGSGAFSLAILAWLAQSGADPRKLPPGEIMLVDQSRPLLELAQANVRRFAEVALPGWPLRLELRPEGVGRYLEKAQTSARFTLVGAAMMLNELGLVGSRHRARAPRIVRQIGQKAEPGGVLLFVEPGTRQGYLNLMPVRNQMEEFPILYPCPHHLACPMFIGTTRRWCHATVQLPPRFFFDEPLQGQGGLPLHMKELNLSALVMQAHASGERGGPFAARAGSRVVSSVLPGRPPHAEGQPVLLLCSPTGRLEERPLRETGPAGRGEWVSGTRFG